MWKSTLGIRRLKRHCWQIHLSGGTLGTCFLEPPCRNQRHPSWLAAATGSLQQGRWAASRPWRVALRRITRAASVEALLEAVQEEVPSETFGLIHASAVFSCIAKRRRELSSEMQKSVAWGVLVERTRDLLSVEQRQQSIEYERELCSLVWAIAKLQAKAPALKLELLPVVIGCLQQEGGRLNSLDISNLFWATATLGRDTPHLLALLPRLMRHASGLVDHLSAQAVATVVKSLGILRADTPSTEYLLASLCNRADCLLEDFRLQELANLCWGLALLGRRDEALLRRITDVVAVAAVAEGDRSAEFNLPQIALAYAKLEVRHPALMDAVADRTRPLVPILNPWGLCALTWSFRVMAAEGTQKSFQQVLEAEVSDRCLTPDEVAQSQHGPKEWR